MPKYIYPPRTSLRISPRFLHDYENGTWLAQRKYNGQRNLIHISPNGNIEFWGRHGSPHDNFSIPSYLREEISNLDLEQGVEYWIDSELMHNKTSEFKNIVILFDIIFAKKYLFGTEIENRLELLNKLCRITKNEETSHLGIQVSKSLFLAKTFDREFGQLFDEALDKTELEGIVLKRKGSKLDNFGQKEYLVSWMVRCRKEHKNYPF